MKKLDDAGRFRMAVPIFTQLLHFCNKLEAKIKIFLVVNPLLTGYYSI